MPFDEPYWWYTQSISWQARALTPAAAVYGAIARRRMTQQPVYRSKLPVLCVGNLTAGGTGKTPLSIALADIVRDVGREPVFLTRGYGGTAKGALLVDPHHTTAELAGDEPLLLARAAPAVVSRDRVAGARLIEKSFSADAVIIMDDGLQNPSLAKSLSLAVVDANRALGNGLCIPAGPLRAPLETQLQRVGAVILTGRAQQAVRDGLVQRLARPSLRSILHAEVAPAGDFKWLEGARIVAFAGIANPERFYTMLERAGATLVDRHSFPDHHAFTSTDAERLLAHAHEHAARLVTTEKDFVRLHGASGTLARLRDATLTLPVTMRFHEAGLSAMRELVCSALA